MESHREINSPEYWDQRFQEDWAAHGGEQYTYAYGELLREHLPAVFFQEMCREKMSLCDWGCAEGEAVAYLSELYPELSLCGVDVSATAIQNAQKKFPDLHFSAENWLAPDAELPSYDAVFTSHVLEHFSNPLEIAQKVLARVARKMIIILVPYAEDPAKKDPEHFFRFLDNNLPVRWEGWNCLHFQVLDTRMRAGLCWRGQQVLLVYGEENWAREVNPARCLDSFRGECDVILQEMEAFKQRSDHEIRELKHTIEQRDHALALSVKKLEVQLLHDQNFIRINESLRSQIDVHKKKRADLGEELKERAGQCAQLKSRNEQLRQDLARTETSYLETLATLRSPVKVTRFYLRALARRLGLTVRAGHQREKAAAPVQVPAPEAASDRPSVSKETKVEGDEKDSASLEVQQLIPNQRALRRTVKSLKELKIASILDTFSQSCFEPEASLLPITPANWKELFQQEEIDFLFVESAWNGNDGAWQYRIASYANPAGSELDELIGWCNSQDIPTVFWNKEDPPNFDRFIQTAVKFDYIFTTDENCVPAYKERCGHDRVYPLMFAAQPAIHNPMSNTERKNKVCFAGTYYADCFPERRRQMENLLAGSIPYGLEIYDRMHGHTGPDSQRYLFPEQFVTYIQGKLSYEDMLKAYKEYRVFLNVNSVQDSPTMFARRVFELLACGTPVVSTPSEGISQIFGDLVPQAATVNETRAALEALMDDEEAWYRQSIRGLRHVMESHCYEHRLQEIVARLGTTVSSTKPKLFVIVDVNNGSPELIAEQLLAQQHRPDGVFVRQKRDTEESRQQQFETLQRLLTAQGIATDIYGSSATIQKLQEKEQGTFFALWDGASVYGPRYLLDALHALCYSVAPLTAMSDCFRLDDQGVLCKPSLLTLSAQKSAYKAGPFCPLKSSFSEHIIAATLAGKMEELFEFPVSRIASAEAIGLGVNCHIRHPFGFLYTAQHPEPLADELSAQIFI